jgi:hypothetical protein
MMAKNPAAVALGKRGRAANSDAQKEASRENGKKGGRPKKHSPSLSARSSGHFVVDFRPP